MKKSLILILIILSLIIIGSIFYYIELNKITKDKNIMTESTILFKNKEYQQGLEKCNQMYYGKETCIVMGVAIKVGNENKTTMEDCNLIPQEITLPFYIINKENLIKNLENIRKECIKEIS